MMATSARGNWPLTTHKKTEAEGKNLPVKWEEFSLVPLGYLPAHRIATVLPVCDLELQEIV